MAHQVAIEIIGGASREDIRDSLGSRCDQRMSVKFTLNGRASTVASVHPLPLDKDEIVLRVVINGMEWEDGSGESFILKGYALRVEERDELISRPFEAYYHTRRRGGSMMFMVD